MSYERWLTDARDLADQIPESSEVHQQASRLISEIAPLGVEVPAYYANTGIMHEDSVGADFVVACNNPSSERDRVHLPKGTLAIVSNNLDRPILYFPDHKPENPNGNGLVAIHELVHIDQSLNGTLKNTPEGPRGEQHAGKAEREAYGLNLQILQAIDGEAVADYLDSWPADIKIVTDEDCGKKYGAIRFTEKGNPLVPTPKCKFYPWESLSFRQRAWNLVANRRVMLDSFPKPRKSTFMRELWDEGEDSRKILRFVGRMAVLEKKLQDKLSSDEIDEIAGAVFSCSV